MEKKTDFHCDIFNPTNKSPPNGTKMHILMSIFDKLSGGMSPDP